MKQLTCSLKDAVHVPCKIVQFSATGNDLYALGEDGFLWQYDGKADTWLPLPPLPDTLVDPEEAP